MYELFAFRLSRVVAALAVVVTAAIMMMSPASARSHRHGAERHVHHHHHYHHHVRHHVARRHHYRHFAHLRRFQREAVRFPSNGLTGFHARPDRGVSPSAMSGGGYGGSTLVSEARRYLGGNPTGRGRLWCARFMNMVLQHTGHHGTGSDMASSFAHYGQRVAGPQVGAIAVMGRRGGGHVGIITGVDAQGNPVMISGNNGNRVREAPVSRGRIYAYVMPN